MRIINDTMREAADRRIGADHAYAIKFAPKVFGLAVLVAALVTAALGVRWLIGHLSAPNVSLSIPNMPGAPLGWIAAAVVGCVIITLLARRVVRHIRYGV